jgi:hypothetical protein
MRRQKAGLGTLFLLGAAWLGAASTASATMPMQKKAKEAGFEATNCLYCHTDKLPKKDAHALNDRGKFLMDQKEKKKAAEIDMSWLKDYKEPEKK